jgi:ankyrin repeat protein
LLFRDNFLGILKAAGALGNGDLSPFVQQRFSPRVDFQQQALVRAVLDNDVHMLESLISNPYITPHEDHLQQGLSTAAIIGNLSIFKKILSTGTNINIPDIEGSTPLLKACQYGQLDIVKYCVEQGAHIEVENDLDCTPLIAAAANGELEIVQYLLENSKSSNCNDK